jgi:hypothetical protein
MLYFGFLATLRVSDHSVAEKILGNGANEKNTR